jgi:hypothetical protein
MKWQTFSLKLGDVNDPMLIDEEQQKQEPYHDNEPILDDVDDAETNGDEITNDEDDIEGVEENDEELQQRELVEEEQRQNMINYALHLPVEQTALVGLYE